MTSNGVAASSEFPDLGRGEKTRAFNPIRRYEEIPPESSAFEFPCNDEVSAGGAVIEGKNCRPLRGSFFNER